MRQRARAQAIVWVAIMLPMLFLPILGLSIDASVLFDSRRDLQNVADAAARVGAMEINVRFLTDPIRNPRGEIQLDPAGAERATDNYLRQRANLAARGGEWDWPQATTDRVTVTVRREVRLPFLRLLGWRSVPIDATGTARPCSGTTRQINSCT